VQKFKALVVAQGFAQIEGLDYDETFAPVAKFESLRVILHPHPRRRLLRHRALRDDITMVLDNLDSISQEKAVLKDTYEMADLQS